MGSLYPTKSVVNPLSWLVEELVRVREENVESGRPALRARRNACQRNERANSSSIARLPLSRRCRVPVPVKCR
jgi:hypothetical protein